MTRQGFRLRAVLQRFLGALRRSQAKQNPPNPPIARGGGWLWPRRPSYSPPCEGGVGGGGRRGPRRYVTRVIAALCGSLFVALSHAAETPPPPPALTVRLLRPDVQSARVMALFQGTRFAHPAEALAAWKRGAGPRHALGKPSDAAIAAFNPAMAGELRGLDQADLVLWFDAADGAPHWYAALPRDDGSFANLALALAMTDGGREPPLGAVAVDRLGPPPSPLLARTPDRFAIADAREPLRRAIGPPRACPWDDGADLPALDSGWLIGVDPEGLGPSGPVGQRRLAAALRGIGCRNALACAGLEGETLSLNVALRLDAPPSPAAAIDLAWLDALPESGLLAAFACTIDPSAGAWDRTFALADRIERADPAHAGVAPLRTRINLLAATVKVRPELDLWPHLRGLSGALLVDPAGAVDGAVLSLHTDSPAAAERIAGQVIPALAPLLGLRKAPAPVEVPAPLQLAGRRILGEIRHRTVSVSQKGDTVRIGWGDAALEPDRVDPANPSLRGLVPPGERLPQRFGAFWPGRLALASTLGIPVAAALGEAAPILWSGRNDAPGAREVVRWSGLRDLVHHFLERLPLDPMPARSAVASAVCRNGSHNPARRRERQMTVSLWRDPIFLTSCLIGI